MPSEQTQRSRYISKYGGENISLPQYLAELMCERLATKNNKTLVFKFWEIPEWKKHFQFQVVMAGRLLKKFHAETILEVIKLNKYAYSLNAKWLLDKYKVTEEKYKHLPMAFDYKPLKENIQQEEIIIEKPREQFSTKKSILGELDNG